MTEVINVYTQFFIKIPEDKSPDGTTALKCKLNWVHVSVCVWTGFV